MQHHNQMREWQEHRELGALPLERRKFLVVEDDLATQPIWEAIIKTVDSSAVIRWATTEEGAEKLIRERIVVGSEFDVVIVDVMLAGNNNGVDLWKRYGGNNSLYLFTSSITQSQFADMIGERQDHYPFLLKKPINAEECIENIRALLDYRSVFIPDSK